MDTELIDTDILIEAIRSMPQAIDCLAKYDQQSILAISVITQLELMVGCRNKSELQKLEKFLRRFKIITLNDQASQIVADLIKKYRLSHGLLIPDALIAATALSYDLPFLTRNQRDFRFITGLNLLSYP